MSKRNRTKKTNANLQKLHKQLNSEQQECHTNPGMTSAAPEG